MGRPFVLKAPPFGFAFASRFALGLPSFISSWGLGGILTMAAMIAAASGGMRGFGAFGISFATLLRIPDVQKAADKIT